MDLKFFYMPGCPYCQRAAGVIAELEQEHPEYKDIKIDKINEILHPLEAKKYDYYYVPAFFDGSGGAASRSLKVRCYRNVSAGVCCVEEKRDGSSPGAGPVRPRQRT